MTIREPHPAEESGYAELPVTHVYRHPDGHGLGHHHKAAGEPALADRQAHPNSPPDWPRSQLTMADLDLADGTGLSHVATDEDTGHLVMAWNDAQGDPRRTSFTPVEARQFLVAADQTKGM